MKPQWLETKSEEIPSPCHKIKAGRKGFLEKTVTASTNFFRDGVFSEEYANKNGLLQNIDPRVKVVTLALLLVAVSFLRHLFIIASLHVFILLLVILSKVSLRFFIPRVWLFIPLFSGVIAIPALFNVIVPGEPLLVIAELGRKWSFGPYEIPETISITRQGTIAASVFVMRVATCVSLVVLLLLTTRWPHLLKALRVLRVPHVFTFIISMAYRYIHLLLRLIIDIHLAKKSRTIKKVKAVAGQKWVSSQMGIVLKRSLKMSEDVYSAMVSRGFTNEIRILDTFKLKRVDYLWSIFFILLIYIVQDMDRMWR